MLSELKILAKMEDMMAYGYICLRQYPKSEKFVLAADTRQSMYTMLDLIVTCNKKYTKKTTLEKLDIELDILRMKVRIGMKLGFLPFKKYEHWAKLLDEIGRMIGGWIRATKRQ